MWMSDEDHPRKGTHTFNPCPYTRCDVDDSVSHQPSPEIKLERTVDLPRTRPMSRSPGGRGEELYSGQETIQRQRILVEGRDPGVTYDSQVRPRRGHASGKGIFVLLEKLDLLHSNTLVLLSPTLPVILPQ